VTSWPSFFDDPGYGPTPSYFVEDEAAGKLLDRLWSEPFACYSQKHEWMTVTRGDTQPAMEFNYCEIFRAELFHGDPTHLKRAMRQLLGDVHHAITSGERTLDTENHHPHATMGGIGTLGITENNARLGILRSVRLLHYAQNQRIELMCEVTLDPNRKP